MMVATPSEVNLQHWIGLLENKTTKVENRVKAYQTITGFMKDGDSVKFDAFVTELIPVLEQFLQLIYSDCKLQEGELSQGALQAFGFCLYQDDITKHISETESVAVLDTLCDVIYQSTDKNTCTRALWCIAKQTLQPQVVTQKIEQLVSAIEHGQCQKMFKSMTVEHEALNALIRLLEQVPEAMRPLGVKWGPLVYGPLVHGAPLVRDKAIVAMETGFSHLMDSQEQLAKRLAADLKAEVLISEMKRLLKNGQESHVLTVWMYYVRLLGKTLHSGSLINHLLPIVEQGFKNPSPKVKVQAYKSWETLIDNFALNPDILGDHKRVKLLMQVFRINNAKYENVAMAKLQAWWHFVVKLGNKVVQYFDQVCVPLLTFCTSGTVNSLALTPSGKNTKHTPNVPRLGALGSPGTPSSPSVPQTFKSVQLKAVQVVAQIIGREHQEADNPKPTYDLAILTQEVLPGIHFFLKHENTFVGVVMQAITNLGDDIEDTLLYYLWHSLLKYIHLSLEVTSKKEHSDCFSHFCTGLREVVSGQRLDSSKVLKMLHPVVNLPEKCLSSLAYQIDEAGALNQGCPALFLIQILLNHRLLETSSSNERFIVLLEKLIGLGFFNETAALSFCESVIGQLGEKAGNVECKETLWRMWSMVATSLSQVIKKSNEVNQGNNLDHDFSALYSTLTFPDLYIIDKDLPQGTMKTLLKTWSDLYMTFSRVAAMVTTVQANLVCEELCALLLQGIKEIPKDVLLVEGLVHQCEVMVKHLDLSAFTQSTELDPAYFFGKKKELGNLTSLVQLLDRVLKTVLSQQKEESSPSLSPSPQLYQSSLSTLSALFTHISSPPTLVGVVDKLAESGGLLLKGGFVKTMPKTAASQCNQKSEKLWTDISSSLQTRYKGPYDSEFLKSVSPLLEATFLHPRRAMKSQTMTFWNATFAKSQALEYPDSLKHVLVKVKEKGHITLPGFDATTVAVLDNTLGSQTTQGESQFAVPVMMTHKSPKKEFGSFLNKVMSPKKSPLKCVSPVKEGIENKTKKQIPPVDLTDMNSKDFVVISTTPKRKRVLTEHQREVMKEQRGNIPTLYSNLEASMDASLMGPLNTSNSQSQMGIQSPESIEITPFPFMRTAGQTTESAKNVAGKSEEQKSKGVNEAKLEDSEENPRKRRRRSVRFSENPNISSEQEPDENVSKGLQNKMPAFEREDKEQESLKDTTQSRRSKRIKSQVTKATDNEIDTTEGEKSSKTNTGTIEVTDAVDSVVFVENTENSKDDVIPETEDVDYAVNDSSTFLQTREGVLSKEEHMTDSGVVCDVKTCDTDTADNQRIIGTRTSKRTTAESSSVKKSCDLTDSVVKASPFRIQGNRRRSSIKQDQKDSEQGKVDKDTTKNISTPKSRSARLAKKNSNLDSDAETCDKEENSLSQDLILSPVKTRQLKLSDIITPPSDKSSQSLLKSPDSDLETLGQSKTRKSRPGSGFKSSQSDSDCSNIVEFSPDAGVKQVLSKGKSRSTPKSSQSDSDTCNVIIDSPERPVLQKRGGKSPIKSPLKQSKSLEFKSPVKYKAVSQKPGIKSPIKSPLKHSKSLEVKSPVKYGSPKKQAYLDGMSTIDKWFTKSSTMDNKTSETPVLDKTEGVNTNKSLFTKQIETQVCTVNLVRVDPVVMAEDTQQFSPVKHQQLCSSIVRVETEQLSVVETPMKQEEEDSGSSNTEKTSATRQLDRDMNEINKDVGVQRQMECVGKGGNEKEAADPQKSPSCADDMEVDEPSLKENGGSEKMLFEKSVTVETNSDQNEQTNKELQEDVFDDIIPSSQDSFGFSLSFSGRKANKTYTERPFAMFSESRDKVPSPFSSAQLENSVESEPIVCGQVENFTPVIVGSCDTEDKIENESETKKDPDLVKEIPSKELVPSSYEAESTVVSESEVEEKSQEKDVLARGITEERTVKEKSKSSDDVVSTTNETKADIIETVKPSEVSNNNNNDKMDKYRWNKRRSERVKMSDNQNKSQQDGIKIAQNETVSDSLTPEDDQTVNASQEDNSQSLFGSIEKVEIVEIKRKNPRRVTKKNTLNADVIDTEEDTKGTGMKKTKKQSIGKVMSKVNDTESVTAEGQSTPKHSSITGLENNVENSLGDRQSMKITGEMSVSEEDSLLMQGIDDSFKKATGTENNKETKTENHQSELEDKTCDNMADSVQEAEDKIISPSTDDEDDISLTDLKKMSEKKGNIIISEKDSEPDDDDDDDDVPLTDLKKISEKRVHENSPECDFGVEPEEEGLTMSQLTRRARNKKSKHDRLKGLLDINMKASSVTKPKVSRSSPNSFLKIKLSRKSSERLKLKKASPKRKRRSKELVVKKAEKNKGIGIVENGGENVVIVNDSCKNENGSEKELDQFKGGEKIEKNVQDSEVDCVDVDMEVNNEEVTNDNKQNSEDIIKSTSDEKSSDVTTELKADQKEQDCVADIKDSTSDEAMPSPVKKAESPQKVSTVKSSPPKKGKPFDIPATPTSSVSKVMGLTRADYIFQKSRLLMGRQATTPSPLHRRSLRAVRTAFSEPRRKQSSILKKIPKDVESPVRTNQNAACKTGSPPSMFRPVNLPQIYSPSASPSAGILKRRRISGDSPADSPSPPNKQRRVSFADSVETRLFENPRSKLYRPSSPRPVSRCLDMPKNTTSPLVTSEVIQATKDEVNPTPDSIKSTQESQLNTTDPIYPSLVACDAPVEQVLPQLTTSVWCRGLGQLLRGKNITTVGQLSMLTEYQIHNLPVRSPKVETVKCALEEFAKSWLSLKRDATIGDALDSSIDSEPGLLDTSGDLLDEIKQLEDEIEEPSVENKNPRKLDFPLESQQGQVVSGDAVVGTAKDIQGTEVLAITIDNRGSAETSDNRGSAESSVKNLLVKSGAQLSEGDFDRKLKRQSIFNGIRLLNDLFTIEELSKLSSHSLVQIQTELNSMMSNVVLALQNKIPLSPSSQNSQE